MKRETFKKRYDFVCPVCGKKQWAAPSIMMTGFGINRGHGSCLDCNHFLHLEIEGGLDGEQMTAIDWEEFLLTRKNPIVEQRGKK